ncbi:MAG: hypothetical protein NT096_01560 [Proteobacteria bacterium]|nr:hypothetical protein [Pseudomonadota bacterium]
MINKEAVLTSIQQPMQRYRDHMLADLKDWMPLEDAARLLLEGKPIVYEEYIPDFRPLIKMMELIVEKAGGPGWDWADPEIRRVFKEVAEGNIYTLFSEVIVDMLISIMKRVPVRTVVEVGTGPGTVTANLCRTMVENHFEQVPIVISDRVPFITQVGDTLRKAYPSLSISDFIWNVRERAPEELTKKLAHPVLLFERFCMPYTGYDALDTIAPLGDILIIVDDLSLTGKKYAYDQIYGKIGSQFLLFEKAKHRLEKYFTFIHACDREAAEAIHSPVITFTLAVK